MIEESRFLNADEYGCIIGGVNDECKRGTAVYAVCTGTASLKPAKPCAILFIPPCDPGSNGSYLVCQDSASYGWDDIPVVPIA